MKLSFFALDFIYCIFLLMGRTNDQLLVIHQQIERLFLEVSGSTNVGHLFDTFYGLYKNRLC